MMDSETKGTVHELSKKAINAKRCPSNKHILNNSLVKSSNQIFQLGVFLPKTEYSEVDLVVVREAVKIYNELLHGPHISIVLSEFQFWVTKWKR